MATPNAMRVSGEECLKSKGLRSPIHSKSETGTLPRADRLH